MNGLSFGAESVSGEMVGEASVLVTGASGFVGRHLCRLLCGKGVRVRALIRREDSLLKQMGVDCWVGDLFASGAWVGAVSGVDYVIHCAGNAKFGNGTHYYLDNVEWTSRLLDVVRLNAPGLRRFVFVSTIGAIDRARNDSCVEPLTEQSVAAPSTDYGRSKLLAEEAVRNAGLPYCIVRPAMVVGPDMRVESHFSAFARHALGTSVFGRIAWPGQFSVVHVDDLAEALWLCATHASANKLTLFCSGEPVEIAQFFESCRKGMWRIPLHWARGIVRGFRWLLPFGLKALLLPALIASDGAIRKLGWRPRYSGMRALDAVIAREQARVEVGRSPSGQTVITGAASGLGLALVERLSSIRPRVLLVDRNREALETLAKRYPHCRILVEDLGSEQGVRAVLASAQWHEYSVSELFACAGIGFRGRIMDSSIERQAGMFHVNVLARLHLAYASVQQMVREGFGRIVLISSSSAFQPLPFMGVYAASNAAVLFLGEAWAEELRGTGIEIVTICPGGMNTRFQATAGVKKVAGEVLLDPATVADAILNAMGSGRVSMVISARAQMMALVARLLPREISVRLWRRLMGKMR